MDSPLRGLFDDALFTRSQGGTTPTLETSQLMTAVAVVRHSDYSLPGPISMMRSQTVSRGTAALPFPDGGVDDRRYALVMHQRGDGSPLHAWLWRQVLGSQAQPVAGAWSGRCRPFHRRAHCPILGARAAPRPGAH